MGRRDSYLDLLRATAILLVVAFHVAQMSPVRLPNLIHVTQFGKYGVDLFFVLSGWLIGGLFWRERMEFGTVDLKRFWMRRWLRTVPPYLCALAIAWGAVWVDRREPFDLGYLLFVQNYYERIPFFLVSWSLCIEEHFYVLLPLLLAFVGRWPAVTVLFSILTLASPISRFVGSLDGVRDDFGREQTGTHFRMEGLVLGFWMAYLSETSPKVWAAIRRAAPVGALLGAGGFFALTFTSHMWTYRIGLTVLALMLVSILLCLVDRVPNGIVRSSWVRNIAVTSYSVYLTHALAIHLARKTIAVVPTLPWVVYFPLALMIIALMGTLFFLAVERTSIQLRDWWVPRRPRLAPRVVPVCLAR